MMSSMESTQPQPAPARSRTHPDSLFNPDESKAIAQLVHALILQRIAADPETRDRWSHNPTALAQVAEELWQLNERQQVDFLRDELGEEEARRRLNFDAFSPHRRAVRQQTRRRMTPAQGMVILSTLCLL